MGFGSGSVCDGTSLIMHVPKHAAGLRKFWYNFQ